MSLLNWKSTNNLTSTRLHEPEALRSIGILIVGLGGSNGTMLLAGVLAKRHQPSIFWFGPRGEGPHTPNWNGCITQLQSRGVHGGVGFRDRIKLADASLSVIGGWDICPTPLGDALICNQVVDYDLARKLQKEMNSVPFWKGYHDSRFISSNSATHILSKKEVPNTRDVLERLRSNIRHFKWFNGIVGHTTVIWSASVEPDCHLCTGRTLNTASRLMKAIEQSDEERGGPLPPSLLYATAAIMEGCSFVNGASQNTLQCGGLIDLAKKRKHGIYCLGTDFKAGQTKFKTAAVEYLRTVGLKPCVVASSNHLGNSDMRHLAMSNAAQKAKLRVKRDIFASWHEKIDHHVSVMFTPMIGDEKRDFVEYTSYGFLNQVHTMVTYTRASDSSLCVPLMIDSAVWCDFFSRCSWPFDIVARALAYLFKIPEGAAVGVDPGFFHQMQDLETMVLDAAGASIEERNSVLQEPVETPSKNLYNRKPKNQHLEVKLDWAIPNRVSIICAGLACIDMQLLSTTCETSFHDSKKNSGQSIELFQGERTIGGGSVSMTCRTLARLTHNSSFHERMENDTVTVPVVQSVIPLCQIGNDTAANKLLHWLEECSESNYNIDTQFIKNFLSKNVDKTKRTSIAVLPIYRDGRRGCMFDSASNMTFTAKDMTNMIFDLTQSTGNCIVPSDVINDQNNNYSTYKPLSTSVDFSNTVKEDSNRYSLARLGAFLFGYPHLLPLIQGTELLHVLSVARTCMEDGGIVALDLNGVPNDDFQCCHGLRKLIDLQNDKVLGLAFSNVDILHLNEEELIRLTGVTLHDYNDNSEDNDFLFINAMSLFISCGVAVVALTRGKKGCLITCGNEERFSRTKSLPLSWIDCTVKVQTAEFLSCININSNGAGDAFLSGLLVAAMLRHTGLSPRLNEEMAYTNTDNIDYEGSQTVASSIVDISLLAQYEVISYSLYIKDMNMLSKGENGNISLISSRFKKQQCKYNSLPFEQKRKNSYIFRNSLNLETAAKFASLVARRHVDVSTRDLKDLDIGPLLKCSLLSPHGTKVIKES